MTTPLTQKLKKLLMSPSSKAAVITVFHFLRLLIVFQCKFTSSWENQLKGLNERLGVLSNFPSTTGSTGFASITNNITLFPRWSAWSPSKLDSKNRHSRTPNKVKNDPPLLVIADQNHSSFAVGVITSQFYPTSCKKKQAKPSIRTLSCLSIIELNNFVRSNGRIHVFKQPLWNFLPKNVG